MWEIFVCDRGEGQGKSNYLTHNKPVRKLQKDYNFLQTQGLQQFSVFVQFKANSHTEVSLHKEMKYFMLKENHFEHFHILLLQNAFLFSFSFFLPSFFPFFLSHLLSFSLSFFPSTVFLGCSAKLPTRHIQHQ